MLAGAAVVRGIEAAGFTHVVWIPDSHLGTWDEALLASQTLCLIRPTREGEAVGIAAGLMLGGARPLVAMQCTGFFEAGDAVRNVAHDLKLPLKLLVGVRSWRAAAAGKSGDNCPTFAEPLVRAWGLPAEWFDPFTATDAACGTAIERLADAPTASVLLWGE
ncbi:MAG: thiamine pyrophosphate-binding protein [Gemmataceae bacterium]